VAGYEVDKGLPLGRRQWLGVATDHRIGRLLDVVYDMVEVLAAGGPAPVLVVQMRLTAAVTAPHRKQLVADDLSNALWCAHLSFADIQYLDANGEGKREVDISLGHMMVESIGD
jgi:hypothetical protein